MVGLTHRDFTLTVGDDGQALAHRPDCRMVVTHRVQGRPIATLFGCEGGLPADIKLHTCLDKGVKRGRAD